MRNQVITKLTEKFSPFFRKYGKYLIIVLILLGLGAGIWISTRPDFVPPEYPDAPLDAMEYRFSVEPQIPEYNPLYSYTMKPGRTPPIKIGAIPSENQMPIFKYTVNTKKWDPKVTEKFLKRVMPHLINVLDTKNPDYKIDPQMGFTKFNFSGYHAEVNLSHGSNVITMKIEKSTAASRQHPFALNGIDVVADAKSSDEKLLQEISWVRDELLKIYPMDVPDASVERSADTITVRYCNLAAHYTNPYRKAPLGSHMTLEFTPAKEDGTTYHLSFIQIDEYFISPNEMYTQYAMSNTIPLKEAKKYLKNGYVLGGHICEKCQDWEEYASIFDYDQVGITYDMGLSCSIPLYVFCKHRCGTVYDEYLCVYVPAIELKNWLEYTESFYTNHDE